MENKWDVLQYCNNHWKAHYITTKIYSQWYKYHDKKMGEPNNMEMNRPTYKRWKTTIEDDLGDCYTDLKTDIVPKKKDNIIASLLRPKEDIIEEPARHILKPKARALRDPLYVLKDVIIFSNDPSSALMFSIV
jgi:hypothetical protein